MEESKPKKRRGPLLNVFLFLATMATTWFAGATGTTLDEAITNGVIFMTSIMGILLSHEMGHYIMARRNRVDASLPYFIPMPLGPIGTFGAVIAMRGRIKSRNALMEIGAAGPLAGLAVAIPILLIGISKSPVIELPPPGSGMMLTIEGQSLIYMFFKWLVVGAIPEGSDINLHPMAWAGWVGLLVTMLNLLPIGQLDGGHIFYALWRNSHARVSRLFFRGLFVLGLGIMSFETYSAFQAGFEGEAFVVRAITGSQWLVLGTLMFFLFGRKKGRGFSHPPVNNTELSPIHKAMGILCVVLFILMFMPIPMRVII